MKSPKISIRYAKAVLDLAVEKNVLDRVFEDFKSLAELLNQSRELTLFYRNPVIKNDKKIKITETIFQSSFHELTLAFLRILINKGRADLINETAEAFIDAYKSYKHITTANVTLAVEPDNELKDMIRKKVEEVAQNNHCEIQFNIKPEIIGGLILRIDDKQWDLSVRSKLNQLQKIFSQNPYIKNF